MVVTVVVVTVVEMVVEDLLAMTLTGHREVGLGVPLIRVTNATSVANRVITLMTVVNQAVVVDVGPGLFTTAGVQYNIMFDCFVYFIIEPPTEICNTDFVILLDYQN